MQNRIIQLMPLPVPGYEFQQADETGSYNETWEVVAAALTDTGRMLPVCYDGRFTFFVMDPAQRSLLANLKRSLKKTLTERKE